MLFACNKEDNNSKLQKVNNNALIIINEGNYNWANSSISLLNIDSSEIQNKVFYKANNRQLGDVAQSICIVDSLGFVLVNNSAKIEVININTFENIATITGITSPRKMILINDTIACISDLYIKSITIINPKSFEITGSIYCGKSTEEFVIYQDKLFVTNWSNLGMPETENNTVQVIDISELKVIDSIKVGKEPTGICIDKDDNLWVLCSGGFLNNEQASLHQINPNSYEIYKVLEFQNSNASPKYLNINQTADTLYFLNNGIFKMSIYADNLPDNAFINSQNSVFYNFTVVSDLQRIFVTNAVDYVQNGYLFEFSMSGTVTDTFALGINPGFMAFRKTIKAKGLLKNNFRFL